MTKKLKLTAETKYELLKEISNKMRDTLELDEILNNLLDTLQNIIEHDAAGIFILSGSIAEHPQYQFPKQYIAGIAQRGFDLPPEKDEMLSLGKGIIGYAIKSCDSIIIPNVHLDSRYIPGREKTQSEIVVPIIKNKIAIGALDVESDNLNAFDQTDLEILKFFADAASMSIEKAILHQQILRKNKVEKQLQIASEVQSRLLPQSSPLINGYDFAGLCIPTYEIGGDYFDYIKIDEDNLAIAVADVSGDGIPAALIMTAFRALLRSQVKLFKDPSAFMKLINIQLSEFTRKKDFVTAFYGILNIKNHNFTYTNCGHNPPMIFKNGKDFSFLDKGGPSLTFIENADFISGSVILNPGDRVVLYTDGVIEIFNNQNEEFGIDRLKDVIKLFPNLSAEKLLNEVINETKSFSKSDFYKDDYTLVILRRLSDIEIIDYSSEFKSYFRDLNLEWLNKYFKVEKLDELILNFPEEYILLNGGFILFAKADGIICGTVAVNKLEKNIFEMTKMAVTEKYQGMQIGKMLAEKVIERVKKSGGKKIILETNSKLTKAINLYKKFGFTDVSYESDNQTQYERPTFKMELEIL